MNRRNFIEQASVGSGAALAGALLPFSAVGSALADRPFARAGQAERRADVVIAGGGLGGCAAALAALRNGLTVIMTEETDWIGGQMTQQGVPPDEHQWIETHGATQLYRDLRTAISGVLQTALPPDGRGQSQQVPESGRRRRIPPLPRAEGSAGSADATDGPLPEYRSVNPASGTQNHRGRCAGRQKCGH